MKKQIFGRKAGSDDAMELLIESGGVSMGGRKADPRMIAEIAEIAEIAVASARRAAAALREKGVEGYVLFEDDPARYEFTPDADFVYPAAAA